MRLSYILSLVLLVGFLSPIMKSAYSGITELLDNETSMCVELDMDDAPESEDDESEERIESILYTFFQLNVSQHHDSYAGSHDFTYHPYLSECIKRPLIIPPEMRSN